MIFKPGETKSQSVKYSTIDGYFVKRLFKTDLVVALDFLPHYAS